MNIYRVIQQFGKTPTSKHTIFHFPQINRNGVFENLHGSSQGKFITKVSISEGMSGWKNPEMAEKVIKFYKNQTEL